MSYRVPLPEIDFIRAENGDPPRGPALAEEYAASALALIRSRKRHPLTREDAVTAIADLRRAAALLAPLTVALPSEVDVRIQRVLRRPRRLG